MKARFVFENIEFNRGRDPKDSLFGLRPGQVVIPNRKKNPDKKGYLRNGIYYIQRVFHDKFGEIDGYSISGLGDVVYYGNIEGYPRFEKLGGQYHTSVRPDEVIGISGTDKEVFEKWWNSEEGKKKREYIQKWDKVVPFISKF
ncbi:MAG TPA: hypothetical protein PK122_06955 [Candidatus Paceibacterota bacterium]|nr:hypothetical protein [Candidatus Paceibacterota bacterium]